MKTANFSRMPRPFTATVAAIATLSESFVTGIRADSPTSGTSPRSDPKQRTTGPLTETSLLGLTFLTVQVNEYVHLGFAPHDHAQGTIFYGLTGLHGAHVFVGLTLLSFATIRAFRGHFTAKEHRGVEVPGIYWHFVDVMWLIVYSTVYIL